MNSAEVRQSFLDFFKSKEHQIVPSASLMPTSPNLLFTNAGMNAFVPCFLGEQKPSSKRIADTQKCIRAGGKHNDLEDVGFDTYHHTLFEMLGNWSFGDYFKKEAIEWGWELLTKVWGFPKDRLYATVYEPGKGEPAEFDQEAYDIWQEIFKKEGMDPAIHIRKDGKKDNFWMMGDTGPCGPCSEIHIDLTPHGDTKGNLVNQDSPFCIEIWNLVFIQFNAEVDGSFSPLSAQHVDTGMGLERVAGIMATTKNFTDYSNPPSNYDSDLFTDFFKHITQKSGHTYGASIPQDRDNMTTDERNDCIFRVLADHIRTLCFAIADGIMPGNEGRHYVLRRILRRAVLFGKRLDLEAGFFTDLVDPLIEKMGHVFPELLKRKGIIKKVIHNEEKTFDRTLDRGLQIFEKIIRESKTEVAGRDAFLLYDTYGFPLDLTQLLAAERHLHVNINDFHLEMERQRQRARESQKKTVITVQGDNASAPQTIFVGYDFNELTGVESEITTVVENKGKIFLAFQKTPFYAEMGGQVGDSGTGYLNGNPFNITNTIKDNTGAYLHETDMRAEENLVGQEVQLSVNEDRRNAIQRHHTATHILHWALRKVLGDHVHQAGSLVNENHLRFDFSHFEAPTPDQLNQVEVMVNQRLLENAEVTWYEVPFKEKPKECIAFFGEKYGDVVRVVDIGGFSVELCGGTHVKATGEMGLLKIMQESAIAAGTRRIEAVAGESAYQLISRNHRQLHELALKLSCKTEELTDKVISLLEQRSAQEKAIRTYQQKEAASQGNNLVEKAIDRNGVKWISSQVQVANPNDMRGIAVQLSQKLGGPSVVILGASFGEKVNILALCSDEAIQAGHKAGDIVRDITSQLGGKGGGKPDFAMGGAKDAGRLSEVLERYLAAGV